MLDTMKPQELFVLLDHLKINNKLVNEDIIIYPDNYVIGSGNYISLGQIKEDEKGCYSEASLSSNFDEFPECISELSNWLKEFKETGTMLNYCHEDDFFGSQPFN